MARNSAPQDTYARLLLSKAYGYPLWFPEPDDNTPAAYRITGVEVGDVGTINPEGGFSFLFNMFKDGHDAVNDRAPDGFRKAEPFDWKKWGRQSDHHFIPGQSITTHHIHRSEISIGLGVLSPPPSGAGAEVGVTFRSSATDGAILYLPAGARRYDAGNLPEFRKYIHRHAISWHAFFRSRISSWEYENDPENSLYLITGFVKCKTWFLASFSDNSEGRNLQLQLKAPVGSIKLRETKDSIVSGGIMSRVWPEKDSSETLEDLPLNQAPFISGYKIRVRKDRTELARTPARYLTQWQRIKGRLKIPLQRMLGGRYSDEGATDSHSGDGRSGIETPERRQSDGRLDNVVQEGAITMDEGYADQVRLQELSETDTRASPQLGGRTAAAVFAEIPHDPSVGISGDGLDELLENTPLDSGDQPTEQDESGEGHKSKEKRSHQRRRRGKNNGVAKASHERKRRDGDDGGGSGAGASGGSPSYKPGSGDNDKGNDSGGNAPATTQERHGGSQVGSHKAQLEGSNRRAADSPPSAFLQYLGPSNHSYHPGDVINRYLLEECAGAMVAATHDDQWRAVMKEGDSTVSNDKELWKRIKTHFRVCEEGGLVYLDTVTSKPQSRTAIGLDRVNTPLPRALFRAFGIASGGLALALTLRRTLWRIFTSHTAWRYAKTLAPHYYDDSSRITFHAWSAWRSAEQRVSWAELAQRLASYLLPWLAVISQLASGDNIKLDDLVAIVLTIGSPTLAVYSGSLTTLNSLWITRRLSHIQYPNSDHAAVVLDGLQQSPISVNIGDEALLASLVVLSDNDEWWQGLSKDFVRLKHRHITTADTIVIAWAFASTAILGYIDGANGALFLYLLVLPMLADSIRAQSQHDQRGFQRAVDHANEITYVANDVEGPGVKVAPAESLSHCSLKRRDGANSDEGYRSPVYNYARFLPWSFAAETISSAFDAASIRAAKHLPVNPRKGWISSKGSHNVHRANREGNRQDVVAYSMPYNKRGRISIATLYSEPRSMLAVALALVWQWAIVEGAILIALSAPTSDYLKQDLLVSSYMLYGAISTIVWLLLVMSAVLNWHCTSSQASVGDLPAAFTRIALPLSVFCRYLGKILALGNTIFIVTVCISSNLII